MSQQRRWFIVQVLSAVTAVAALIVGCFVTMWVLPFAPIGYFASQYAYARGTRAGDLALLFFAYSDKEPTR